MAHALDIIEERFGMVPRGLIHVGGSVGDEVADFRRWGIDPAVIVEPLDGAFARLAEASKGDPAIIAVKACLSDVEGRRVVFHVASNDGASSSYLKPTGHLAAAPDVTFDGTVGMTTTTLDATIARVATEHGFPTAAIEYLGLDTQGSELDILRGGEAAVAAANFIYTEASFGQLYEGSASVYDIEAFLRRRGFDMYDLRMGAHGWGDALFVRSSWVAAGQARFVAMRTGEMSRHEPRRGFRQWLGQWLGRWRARG